MNIVSGIKSLGQRPHCFLRVQIKRLFIGRLTDFYDDLKVVREIEVCLRQKKKAWVNFWIASVNVKLS